MKRAEPTLQLNSLVKHARRMAKELDARAILVLVDRPYDFVEMKKMLRGVPLYVAAHETSVLDAAEKDEVDFVKIEHEPETRVTQLSQALLEALADNHVQTGDCIVALYPSFDRDEPDTVSVINLGDQLTRLRSSDLRRLETQVPLETLRRVVEIAADIGIDGREGKNVGTIFVVGNHRKVLQLSSEGVHDPFRGYSKEDRTLRNPRVVESIKEIAQMDGAFVITADGYVQAAGRMLHASDVELTLSTGLGARHWAAAQISKATNAVAIAVSESTGTVRIFLDGRVVLRIEPVSGRSMKFHEVETAPHAADS
ncbi:MAG: DNA integrity scanning protein DisA nucleotide-binding domain protein [Planctomycetaceae bacterium]